MNNTKKKAMKSFELTMRPDLELGSSNLFSSVEMIALMTPLTRYPWNRLNTQVKNTYHRMELKTWRQLERNRKTIGEGNVTIGAKKDLKATSEKRKNIGEE